MIFNRIKRLGIGVSIFVLALTASWSIFALSSGQKSNAIPSITISSPTSGQTFSGNEFTISGTTEPNSTVLIQKGQKVLKQTISSSDGKWSVQVSGLPDGENILTAKVVKASTYAYYSGTPDISSFTLNQLRLSDSAVNPNGGWPIAQSRITFGLASSPDGHTFYGYGGLVDNNVIPAKIDINSPADGSEVISYPAGAGGHVGTFNTSGTKYFSPNTSTQTISVVDVASNTVEGTINTSFSPGSINRSETNQKLYTTMGNKIGIIDSNYNIEEIPLTNCTTAFVSMSSDPTHPYYYATCFEEGTVQKFKLEDNSLVDTWNIGGNPINLVLSADSTKAFTYASILRPNSADTDKIKVIDTQTGQVTNTIQLLTGAVFMFTTPDFQNLYVPTPGDNTDIHNIDKVNMTDYSVEHIDIGNDIAAVVTAPPSTTADIANASVGIVLGVKTTTSNLSETGALAVSSTLLAGILIASFAYLYSDYRRHRKPLMAEDTYAQHSYTFAHHIKTVSIPILKYRLHFSVDEVNSDSINRF